MADISSMDRQRFTTWLPIGTLLTALCMPLVAQGGNNIVILVGEKPLEEVSAPAVEVESPKPVATQPIIDILIPRKAPLEFITLNSVLFSHDGTALDNRAKLILNDIAAYLHNNDAAERLLISGFADKTDSEAYNAKLSAKRAFVVREYLRHKGVAPRLMHTVGWGEGYPADEHWTRQGRKRNRRVELHLVQKPLSM